MAVIDQFRDILTVVSEYDVNPDQAESVVASLKELHLNVGKLQAGFISTNLHVSLDQKKVVNYSQWKSEEVYRAFLENAEAKKIIKEVESFAPREVLMKVRFAS